MRVFELFLACLSALVNARLVRRPAILRLALTAWSTLSLSTSAAHSIGLFDWLPGVAWIRAAGVIWFVLSLPLLLATRIWSKSSAMDPGRRRVLRIGAALTLSPVLGGVFAIRRSQEEARIRQIDLPVPGLPRDLHGLRIVQISDVHLGPFFSRDQLRRVVDQANGLGAHVVAVTGDLITYSDDPLQDAIDELARLRSVAGVYGCLGNHEALVGIEDEAARASRQRGMRFLRTEAELLRFGEAELNVAGVDYQEKSRPYLAGAAALRRAGAFNLLLSHNPDVFPVAASHGWDLTLAGHTHGGQITLEYLHPSLNPARFYTPFISGLYRFGKRAGFVTSGLGTVGVPARLGTAPEIALIRLGPSRPAANGAVP